MGDYIDYNESDRQQKFELHPKGQCKAVCVDVIDLGEQENPFKKDEHGSPVMVHKVAIVWETDRKKANGRPFTIKKRYTLSLYDGAAGGRQAALYTDLSSWLGTDWNGKQFPKDLEGRPAKLFIRHEAGAQDATKVFAKIISVDPDDDDSTLMPSGSYKRFVPTEDPVPF